MRRSPAALALLLLAALPLSAQPVRLGPPAPPQPAPAAAISLPATLSTRPGRILKITAASDRPVVKWVATSPDYDLIQSESGKWAIFSSPTPGVYVVAAYTALADGTPTDPAYCLVSVEGPAPPPVPPVPPGPGPVPPGPTPGPTPPPGPVKALRVLLVYEAADLPKLPRGQAAVLASTEVRKYLSDHCVKGPDGKTAEWREWDQNVDASGESAAWQELLKRPRQGLPWLVIADGPAVVKEVPLPADVASTLALLKQYGG